MENDNNDQSKEATVSVSPDSAEQNRRTNGYYNIENNDRLKEVTISVLPITVEKIEITNFSGKTCTPKKTKHENDRKLEVSADNKQWRYWDFSNTILIF